MSPKALPFHRHLRHPRTGQRIQALGLRRSGLPIWPILGAADGDPDPAEEWAKLFPDMKPEDVKAALDAKSNGGDDEWTKLFPDLKPDDVKKAVDESRKWETRAKGNKTKADQLDALAKLLNGESGDDPDPAKLASDLTAAQQQARDTRVENAVLKAAGKHGADPVLLVDSRSFMSKISTLDPAEDDFQSNLGEAIKKAVEETPALKGGGAGGVRPNRQQGNPSEGKQGGVQAGREMFAASRKTASASST